MNNLEKTEYRDELRKMLKRHVIDEAMKNKVNKDRFYQKCDEIFELNKLLSEKYTKITELSKEIKKLNNQIVSLDNAVLINKKVSQKQRNSLTYYRNRLINEIDFIATSENLQ